MALDTRSKRASSVSILAPFVLAPPLPDSTIDQGDRQHIALSYSGILASELVAVVVSIVGTVYVNLTPTGNVNANPTPTGNVGSI